MKTQDVIDLALAAGLYQDGEMFFSLTTGDADVHISDLERFAELVRQDEREACAKLCEMHYHGKGIAMSIRGRNMYTKSQNVDTLAKRVYASDISATSDKSGISDKADEQAEKQDAESLFKFMANNKEVLLLDEQGFHYKGDVVHDAGIAYRLFVEWMKESTLQEITDIGQWDTPDMAHRLGGLSVEQEPVGWFAKSWQGVYVELMPEAEDAIPLYTAPPKREWVGLTDEELEEYSKWSSGKNVVKSIEAKLKEKNT